MGEVVAHTGDGNTLAGVKAQLGGPGGKRVKNVLVFDAATDPADEEMSEGMVAWLLSTKSASLASVVVYRRSQEVVPARAPHGSPASQISVSCPACPASFELDTRKARVRGHWVIWVCLDLVNGGGEDSVLPVLALLLAEVNRMLPHAGIGVFSPHMNSPGGALVLSQLASLGYRVENNAVPPAVASDRAKGRGISTRKKGKKGKKTSASPLAGVKIPARLDTEIAREALVLALDSMKEESVGWLRASSSPDGYATIPELLSVILSVQDAKEVAGPSTNAFAVAINRVKIWLSHMAVNQRSSLPKTYKALFAALQAMTKTRAPPLFPAEYLALELIRNGIITFCRWCGSLVMETASDITMASIIEAHSLTTLGSIQLPDSVSEIPDSSPFTILLLTTFAQTRAWLDRMSSKRISLPVLIRGLASASLVKVSVSPRSIIDKLQIQRQYFTLREAPTPSSSGASSSTFKSYASSSSSQDQGPTIQIVYFPPEAIPPPPQPFDLNVPLLPDTSKPIVEVPYNPPTTSTSTTSPDWGAPTSTSWADAVPESDEDLGFGLFG